MNGHAERQEFIAESVEEKYLRTTGKGREWSTSDRLMCRSSSFLAIFPVLYRFRDVSNLMAALVPDLFLEKYMRRLSQTATAVKSPKGGLVLSDGVVIQKLSREPNGERFMILYRGDWEKQGPEDSVNWSHSGLILPCT